MAALSANLVHETAPRAGRESYLVVDADIVYAGALVGVSAAGFLIPWDNTATSRFVGIALDQVTGDTSADIPVEVACDTEGRTLLSVAVASAVQGSVGAQVFSTTDNVADLALTATSPAIGWIKRFVSASDCDVVLYSTTEASAEQGS